MTHKLLWDFNIKTDHLISAKRICKIVDFDVPADHWIKLKESEKKDKYFEFERELKKLWNKKLTFIPIVTGALGTVT